MNRKKIFKAVALLLCAFLALATLAGCGKKKTDPNTLYVMCYERR